jgi:hypothetical protein
MKVNREKLLTQLESVQPGLSPREIIQQSSCFVFKKGKVFTFNDEVACSHKCVLEIKGAVQAAPLLGILKKMEQELVDIEIGEDSKLVIKGKGNEKVGIVMDRKVVLPISLLETPDKWQKLHKEFAEAVSLVQKCASRDESDQAKTCVHIHQEWIEACDDYQMARFKLKTRFEKPTLVRRDSLKHMTEFGMVEFSETDTWIHFRNPIGLILSCRKYAVDYLDLSSVFSITGTPATLPKGLGKAAEKAGVF